MDGQTLGLLQFILKHYTLDVFLHKMCVCVCTGSNMRQQSKEADFAAC